MKIIATATTPLPSASPCDENHPNGLGSAWFFSHQKNRSDGIGESWARSRHYAIHAIPKERVTGQMLVRNEQRSTPLFRIRQDGKVNSP